MIIIDGNALIHRSFHALPPTMRTKAGQMTNAVYGFTMVLLKALREFKPEYVALTLDRKAPTFRHEAYKEYKAKRIKAPDELYEQIPLVKKVAESFTIPIYEKDGYEADDLIGTIVNEIKIHPAAGGTKFKNNIENIIVTGDLDTLQLVDEGTKVYTMSHGLSDSVIYDKKAVRGRFGLLPEQMIDYKALRGDPSDNIPGVRGIGEKTAIDLLKGFGTLEKIYEYVEKIHPGKYSAKAVFTRIKITDRILNLLIEYKDDAFLSKKLATIEKNAPIKFNLEEARFGQFSREKVVELFSELEFKSLLPRIKELDNRRQTTDDRRQKESEGNKFERNKRLFKYQLIDPSAVSAGSPRPELGTKAPQASSGQVKFDSFLAKLKKQKEFVFDVETSSFDPLTTELLGISFCWKEGEAYFVKNQKSSRHRRDKNQNLRMNLFNYQENNKNTNNEWLEKMRPIFEDEKIKKIGHNIKYDLRVLQAQGVDAKGIDFDTMIASYLLNPGSRQHNLDAVTFSELGFEKISKEDLLGKGRDKISFSEVPLENLYIYSCEDADFTWRLKKKLVRQLKEQKLDNLFREIEMPLVSVLAEMENNGVRIDVKMLAKISKETAAKIKKLKIKIKKQAGVDFNINSTQQLREILFEKLGIPTAEISKTKTGLSTAAEELEKIKSHHPIVNLIQEYRELAKLSSTYIDALPELVNKKTGRLHTSFNQTVTATGRLSSSEPNLQNIPARAELGQKIRKAFIADDGFKLLSLDYSQIELRLAAHMSGDEKMIKAFKRGDDIHTATAMEINGVSAEEVTPVMRREAKAINFGILYGQGPHGLSQTADIPYARAREFIENYFASFPKIKKFVDEAIGNARKKGYAETMFGRRRFLPEINSSVMQVRKAAERMAINMPLQGTAADMIKAAMIKVPQMTREFNPPHPPLQGGQEGSNNIRMLLQVHDELLFEARGDKVKEAAEKIKKIMENVLKIKVPIVVDAKVGENWGKMRTIHPGKYSGKAVFTGVKNYEL